MTLLRSRIPLILLTAALATLLTSTAGARVSSADGPFTAEEKSLFHLYLDTCAAPAPVSLPDGAAFDPARGLVTWLPAYGAAGDHLLRFTCDDGPDLQLFVTVRGAEPVEVTVGTPKITLAGTTTWPEPDFENDQKSWAALADLYGLDTELVTDLEGAPAAGWIGDILIVPWHVAVDLDPAAVQQVVDFVRAGGSILLSGRSPLSEALGISFDGGAVAVTEFRDFLNPGFPFVWSAGETVETFAAAPGDAVFTATPDGEVPLAVGRQVGDGRMIYLATRHYDRHSPFGTKGHPYLVYHFADFFKLRSPVSAGGLDVYFDPGNYDLTEVYVEDLAARWAELGIKTVYVAAWHFWVDEETGAEWTFGYDHFIEVCHRRGILVYAWFAFPHVSQKFWVQNPECREQTGAGTEINETVTITWRSGINFQDPSCVDKVIGFLDRVLLTHAWDGINLAEFYYEFLRPDPAWFTPLNRHLRDDWRSSHGYDPIEFFDPSSPLDFRNGNPEWADFLDHRKRLVTEAHRTLLSEVFARTTPDTEVIVTLIDGLHDGYEGFRLDDVGVDVAEVVRLMEEFDYTLEMEDQVALWSANPYRYSEFRQTYEAAFPLIRDHPERLIFDFNVHHEAHDPYYALADPLFEFPSYKQTGIEVMLVLKDLHADRGRAALFSENTAEHLDLVRARWLLAADTAISRTGEGAYSISAGETMVLHPSNPFRSVFADGSPWPAWSITDGRVLLPVGDHSVGISSESADSGLRLADINCGLLDASVADRALEVRYHSPRHKAVLTVEAFAVTDADDFEVRLDGAPHDTEIHDFYGHFHLFLPKGEHTVHVTTRSGNANQAPASGPATENGGGSCFLKAAGSGRVLRKGIAATVAVTLFYLAGILHLHLRKRARVQTPRPQPRP